ncbi:MAG: hypothetical protein H8E13_10350 [Actinobacteria bacterium]|nr:hypothetical protein [Actinomycetota bacterium]
MTDKKKKNTKKELNILDRINADDGLVILKRLAEEDVSLLKRIEHAASEYFKEDEPILITRNGKVAGLYIPLEDADSISLEVRKELLYKFGEYISKSLEKTETKEENIIAEFTRYRKACS